MPMEWEIPGDLRANQKILLTSGLDVGNLSETYEWSFLPPRQFTPSETERLSEGGRSSWSSG